MTKWQEAYDTGTFRITTDQPSEIIRKNSGMIPSQSRVMDLGCGAGRNALFLASLGHPVDAIDIVDLGWPNKLTPGLAPINFRQQAVDAVDFGENHLGAVLMMRLIQYLPEDQIKHILKGVNHGLVGTGVLFMNYSVSGGGRNIEEFDLDQYEHPVDDVMGMVESAGLTVVDSQEKTMPQPVHTNLPSSELQVCDLVAVKS